MLRNLILHGKLAKSAGLKSLKLDCSTPAEAVRGLLANFPHLKMILTQGSWHVIKDKVKKGNDLAEHELAIGLGKEDLHLLPEMKGKGGGLFQTILGIGLIAAALIFPATWALAAPYLLAGASLVLGGLAQMLAPSPNLGDPMGAGAADQRPSFMFSSPINVVVQGGPVPLAFGKILTGSYTISTGITSVKT